MKIRIKGNSIRFRLSQSDIELFNKEGIIKEETNFGNGQAQFLYALVNQEDAEKMTAAFQNNEIRVLVPEDMATNWTATDLVGLSAQMPLENEESLSILIEKDFKCLTVRAGEDEGDNFPNPHTVC
ncbi:MAG: hypothetical protein ACI9XO_000918 [Paraglaciecola sp.]|jgi:hypothetical protein